MAESEVSHFDISDNPNMKESPVSVDENNNVIQVNSSKDPSHSFSVTTLHISCASDKFQRGVKYTGFILYGMKGYSGSDVFMIGERRCRPGYICIVKSEKAKKFQPESGHIHEGAFRSVFGCSIPKGLFGDSFDILKHEVSFHSSFVHSEVSDFFDKSKEISKGMKGYVQWVVEEWMSGCVCQNFTIEEIQEKMSRD